MISKIHVVGNAHILVVNDNATESEAIIGGLEYKGFQVRGASSPDKAIQALSEDAFDVVLIDLILPDMNGLKLARKIRSLFPTEMTMLMSDYLLSPVQLAKADTGVVGFIPKPVRFEEIASFVRQKLEARSKGEDCSTDASNSAEAKATFDVLTVQYSF